jgi:hypothetical protein
MSFSHAVFHPVERSDQRLILYSPLPENDTAAKLTELIDESSRPIGPLAPPPRLAAVGSAG